MGTEVKGIHLKKINPSGIHFCRRRAVSALDVPVSNNAPTAKIFEYFYFIPFRCTAPLGDAAALSDLGAHGNYLLPEIVCEVTVEL